MVRHELISYMDYRLHDLSPHVQCTLAGWLTQARCWLEWRFRAADGQGHYGFGELDDF